MQAFVISALSVLAAFPTTEEGIDRLIVGVQEIKG